MGCGEAVATRKSTFSHDSHRGGNADCGERRAAESVSADAVERSGEGNLGKISASGKSCITNHLEVDGQHYLCEGHPKEGRCRDGGFGNVVVGPKERIFGIGVSLDGGFRAVSYTHLRAHET